jgi:hypothetical protein
MKPDYGSVVRDRAKKVIVFIFVATILVILIYLILGIKKQQESRVIDPKVAQFQNEIKTMTHGDLIRTKDGNIYFIVGQTRDRSGLSTKLCVECATYWFNSELLMEQKAEIIHHGDEHYASGLDQFAQHLRKKAG